MAKSQPSTLVARRLREARDAQGISQKALGIKAGLDEFVASARINRYEQSVHEPDSEILGRLAKVLNLPAAYFYAEDDHLAEVIAAFHRGTSDQREAILMSVRQAPG